MISPTLTPDGELVLTFDKLSRGIDTQSPPTETMQSQDGSWVAEGTQNVTVQGGYYRSLPGTELFATGMVMPDGKAPTFLALHSPSTGTARYLAGSLTGGRVYYWDGSAWVTVRVDLSTTAGTYWTSCGIGDYLVLANPRDGVYKWDGTHLLPIGAKFIADCETGEAGQWTNATADTTNYKEGLQAVYVESSGSPANMVFTPATNLDGKTGLLLARDYEVSKSPGTDFYHFMVMFSNTGTIDTTNTKVVLSDGDAESLTFPYTAWDIDRIGTPIPSPPVPGTWYAVYLPAKDGTDSATFDPANIDSITFSVDTSAGTLRMVVDDIYVIYATTMPAVQYVRAWKNMLIGACTGDDPSEAYYSPVSGPDQWDADAVLPIDLNDGTDITGTFPFYDQFFVFKDSSVHILTARLEGLPYPEYTISKDRVTGEHGCSSHRGLVEAGGFLFIPWRGHIYQFKGVSTTKISYRVDPTLGDFAPTALSNMVGAPLRSENLIYWWWTPDGATTNTRCIAYDYAEKAFLPVVGQTMALAETVLDNGAEYLLTADYTGRILQQHTGALTEFDGVDFTSTLTLPWVSGGPPHAVVSWRELQVPYDTNTGTLTVQYRVASHPREFGSATWVTAGTIDMSVAGEYGRVWIGERGRWLQVRFSVTDDPMTLYWPIALRGRPQGYPI